MLWYHLTLTHTRMSSTGTKTSNLKLQMKFCAIDIHFVLQYKFTLKDTHTWNPKQIVGMALNTAVQDAGLGGGKVHKHVITPEQLEQLRTAGHEAQTWKE